MTDTFCLVAFPDTAFPPLKLQPQQSLSEHLTVQNSPVLFGCRTGVCGTCLVRATGKTQLAEAAEQEVIETLAPDYPNARLACQIILIGDIELHKIG